MAKIPRAKLEEKLKENADDWFDEDDLVDILRGLETKKRRRRRGDSGAGVPGVIVISPSTITIADTTPVGTVIANISISGGYGTYTLSLVDPSSQFMIVGNTLQVQFPLVAGTYPITINATNGIGDNPTISTVVTVTHIVGYVPTYPEYGF
jgi:hypothetical protein